MSRLFITQREINLINDIGKEIVKDVIGQKIYFFPISEEKSNVHSVYEESVTKIFDNPIEIPSEKLENTIHLRRLDGNHYELMT